MQKDRDLKYIGNKLVDKNIQFDDVLSCNR